MRADARSNEQGDCERKGCTTPYRIVGLLAATWLVLSAFRLIFSMAVPVFVEETSVSYAGISVLFGALFVGYGLSQFPAGCLADVVEPRVVLVGGIVLASGALASLSVASSYLHVFVAVLLVGIGIGAYRSVSQIAVGAITPRRSQGAMLGLLTAGNPAGYVVGPVVIGLLLDTYGLYATPLLLSLVPLLFAVRLASTDSLPAGPDSTAVDAPSLRRGLETFREHSRRRRTLLVIGLGSAFTTVSNSLIAVLPLYLVETTSLTLTTGGIYAGGIFGVGAVAALISGAFRDRVGVIPVLLIGFSTAAGALSLIVLTSAIRTILPLLCLFSLGLNGILPARDFVINAHAERCSQAYVGGMIGGLRSACYLGGGIGAAGVGLFFGRFGFEGGFSVLVSLLAIGALCTVALWFTDRGTDDRHQSLAG